MRPFLGRDAVKFTIFWSTGLQDMPNLCSHVIISVVNTGSSSVAPGIPCALCSQPLATTLLFSVPRALPLQECRRNGILQCVAMNVTHLRFIHAVECTGWAVRSSLLSRILSEGCLGRLLIHSAAEEHLYCFRFW